MIQTKVSRELTIIFKEARYLTHSSDSDHIWSRAGIMVRVFERVRFMWSIILSGVGMMGRPSKEKTAGG